MVFPVLTHSCESWTIKKAEGQKIDPFELWCWRRLLRVPWTARRSNQSVLREINPEYSLEGLTLMLKLQCFAHLMWTVNSLEKSLMLGKIEGKRRRGHYRIRWLDGITNALDVNSRRWWGAGMPGVLQTTGSQRVGHDWATEQREWQATCQHKTIKDVLFWQILPCLICHLIHNLPSLHYHSNSEVQVICVLIHLVRSLPMDSQLKWTNTWHYIQSQANLNTHQWMNE